jgi:hypothetical protein
VINRLDILLIRNKFVNHVRFQIVVLVTHLQIVQYVTLIMDINPMEMVDVFFAIMRAVYNALHI